MDVNTLYECIGYGATQAVASAGIESATSRIPARIILDTASDPVGYCIAAYAKTSPLQAGTIDTEGRAMILAHLEREARVAGL